MNEEIFHADFHYLMLDQDDISILFVLSFPPKILDCQNKDIPAYATVDHHLFKGEERTVKPPSTSFFFIESPLYDVYVLVIIRMNETIIMSKIYLFLVIIFFIMLLDFIITILTIISYNYFFLLNNFY